MRVFFVGVAGGRAITSASPHLVRIEAPDELAAVLLADRLGTARRAEIVQPVHGRWEVHVAAGGPSSFAVMLSATREWLEAEQIEATRLTAGEQSFAFVSRGER